VEVWLREHREAFAHADSLVELLAPDDIQDRLLQPNQVELRARIAGHLKAFVDLAQGHFRAEESLLVPAIQEHIGLDDRAVREAVGCLSREHGQMHMFAERILDLLSVLESSDPPPPTVAGELLRVSYGVQSLLRHHCTKEEKEIYSLVGRLPQKVVTELLRTVGEPEDIRLDHLIRPLGSDDAGYPVGEDVEGPEN